MFNRIVYWWNWWKVKNARRKSVKKEITDIGNWTCGNWNGPDEQKLSRVSQMIKDGPKNKK